MVRGPLVYMAGDVRAAKPCSASLLPEQRWCRRGPPQDLLPIPLILRRQSVVRGLKQIATA